METMASSTFQKYAAYKDSGEAWLGVIPENWELRRFKYLFREINERSFDGSEDLLSVSQYTGVTKKSDKVAEGDLISTASTLEGYKKVYEGDLVSNIMLAWNGSLGFSPFDGITSPAYSVYRLSARNSIQYFHYLLRSEVYKSEFKRNSSGVIESRLRLYTDDFFAIWSILPPLPEQTAIAAFLDDKTTKIDHAIAQKQKLIELLKERKQIVIQELVTGKKVWNSAQQAWTKPAKTKYSGMEWIGEIPEEWTTVKFKFLIRTKARLGWKGLKADEYVEQSPYGFLSTPNIKNNDIAFEDAYFISEFRYNESPEIMLQVGDVLLVKDGSTLGISNLVKTLPVKCTVNSSIAVLRVIDLERLTPMYLNLFLKSETCQNLIEKKKDGMGVPHLFQRDINNFSIPIFDIQDQKRIVAHIGNKTSKIDAAISLQEQQIEKLKEYKATLIDGAVTGKIKVV